MDEPRGTKALLFLGTSGLSDMVADLCCWVKEWDIRFKKWVGMESRLRKTARVALES